MKLLGLDISDLKDGYCISTVTLSVLKTPGAYLIAVLPGVMVISYEPLLTSVEKITRAVTRLGYKIKRIVQQNTLTQILASMKTLKFKTNIKCSGCLARVSPILNEAIGEDNWEVDVKTPEKILTVVSDEVDESSIIFAINEAGFIADRLN
ncbi:heavy-metal-associated domain-containing protein [Pedobacter sp. PLR]|uniref:heavy-metal-associated domain-containing protein n=1 Tax=Pedobacter sp. PLR TaxID=2994465 RepID=UPI0022467F8F|nr:heavy-metal-associated domain-containing protein [Pedobacter sp. PLR]MCX2452016.1 heavy-metal-associated domain-containing protein [Pedobacter sp. PLR]